MTQPLHARHHQLKALRDAAALVSRLSITLQLEGSVESLEAVEDAVKALNGHAARIRRGHSLMTGYLRAERDRAARAALPPDLDPIA